jgi:chemotaxis protein CheC
VNLAPLHADALREIINIGVGRAASMLNNLVRAHIQLRIPEIRVVAPDGVKDLLSGYRRHRLSVVRLPFQGRFSGAAELVFPEESAAKLVAVLASEDALPLDVDGARSAALAEVGNIVLNGVMGSFANLLKQPLRYAVPIYTELGTGSGDVLPEMDATTAVVFAQIHCHIHELHVVGDIILVFGTGSFDALLASIDGYLSELA